MAKKEGRVSLSRLLREADEKKQLRNRMVLVAAIIGAVIILVAVLGYLLTPAPAYEFKTGINHPSVISNWLKNGTVVLYFTEDNCPPCDFVAPKIADLQSQYKGTNVTINTLNFDENATVSSIGTNYGITLVPQVFVIRPDGAVANFSMKKVTDSDSFHPLDGSGSYSMDFNAIRSAIEDAQNWHQTHLT